MISLVRAFIGNEWPLNPKGRSSASGLVPCGDPIGRRLAARSANTVWEVRGDPVRHLFGAHHGPTTVGAITVSDLFFRE